MPDGDVLLVESGHQAFGTVPVHGHAESDVTGLEADLGAKMSASVQSNVASLSTGGIVLLSDAIAAITALQSKVNEMLAAQKAAGQMTPD